MIERYKLAEKNIKKIRKSIEKYIKNMANESFKQGESYRKA